MATVTTTTTQTQAYEGFYSANIVVSDYFTDHQCSTIEEYYPENPITDTSGVIEIDASDFRIAVEFLGLAEKSALASVLEDGSILLDAEDRGLPIGTAYLYRGLWVLSGQEHDDVFIHRNPDPDILISLLSILKDAFKEGATITYYPCINHETGVVSESPEHTFETANMFSLIARPGVYVIRYPNSDSFGSMGETQEFCIHDGEIDWIKP